MQIDSPHSVRGQAAPGGAVVQQVESSKLLPWLMLTAILSGGALMGAVGSILFAHYSYEETRQLQIQVMDQNALFLRNGWREPGDLVYGPAANLEYRPKSERRIERRASDNGTAKSRN